MRGGEISNRRVTGTKLFSTHRSPVSALSSAVSSFSVCLSAGGVTINLAAFRSIWFLPFVLIPFMEAGIIGRVESIFHSNHMVRMKPLVFLAIIFAGMSFAAGCQGYVPKTPDPDITVAGSYRSVSDCAYVKLRNDGWTMTPLDTKQMIEFDLMSGGIPVSRIEVFKATEDTTRIVPFQMKTLTGRGVGSFEPLTAFRECATPNAVIVPLSKDPG